MKTLKSLITVIVFSLFVTTAFANSSTETTSSEELREEVSELLGSHSFSDLDKSIEAEFSFIVNRDNEIVVLSVDTKSKGVETFVKRQLNYKKIHVVGLRTGKVFKMPITIE